MPDQTYNAFLKLLKQFSGIERLQDFAKACGKYPQNMSAYINGTQHAGVRVAKAAFDSYCKHKNDDFKSSLFKPLHEISDLAETNIPTLPGIYIIYDSSAEVIYIGQAKNFKTEVRQTLDRKLPTNIIMGPKLEKKRPTIKVLAKYISLYRIDDPALRANIEALLIRVSINHTHNSNLGHFRKTLLP